MSRMKWNVIDFWEADGALCVCKFTPAEDKWQLCTGQTDSGGWAVRMHVFTDMCAVLWCRTPLWLMKGLASALMLVDLACACLAGFGALHLTKMSAKCVSPVWLHHLGMSALDEPSSLNELKLRQAQMFRMKMKTSQFALAFGAR